MPYFELEYGPNWKGIDSNQSLWDIDLNSLGQGSTGFLILNNGIFNGVKVAEWAAFYTTPDAGVPYLVTTILPAVNSIGIKVGIYLSDVGNVWRTNVGSAAMTNIGAFPYGLNIVMYSVAVQGNLYVTGANGLTRITPPATVASLTAVTGGIYIGELGGHILCASTSEGGTNFPYRLRWSGVYNFGQWNPAVDATAGFQDLSDVNDVITGLFTFGTVGYILRSQGITQITVTSQGTAPFQFDHLWKSFLGIGCLYPYSAAQYGPLGIFAGQNDIYLLSSSGYEAIGGISRQAIMTDLRSGGSTLEPRIIGSIVPFLTENDGVSRGSYVVSGLSYILSIPLIGGGSILWIYNLDGKTWSRIDLTTSQFTSPFSAFYAPSLAESGVPFHGASPATGGNYGQGLVVACSANIGVGFPGVAYIAPGASSDVSGALSNQLSLKVIRPKAGRDVTVHKIVIDGQAFNGNTAPTSNNISVRILPASASSLGSLLNISRTFMYNNVATLFNNLFSCSFDKVVTDKAIFIQIFMLASYVLKITKITIFGSYGDGDQL